MEDQIGWRLIFSSPYLDSSVEKICLNVKMNGTLGNKAIAISSGISQLFVYWLTFIFLCQPIFIKNYFSKEGSKKKEGVNSILFSFEPFNDLA